VPAEPSDPTGQAAMIAAALELIREVDPRRGEQIASGIKWYVPLVGADPSGHRSRTVANLRGVVFLSPGRDRWMLAEAIVHEYYHSVLHARMEMETLLTGGEERRFYSPWREDPRPLAGLLHALYVFAGLADFFLRAEGAPSLAEQRQPLRERRRLIVAQLRLGHAQAPLELFTLAGRRLLEALAAVIDRHEAELELPRGMIPDALATHLRKWCAANPELSRAVRRPDPSGSENDERCCPI
jgi:HEXXH motif-containing protein